MNEEEYLKALVASWRREISSKQAEVEGLGLEIRLLYEVARTIEGRLSAVTTKKEEVME